MVGGLEERRCGAGNIGRDWMAHAWRRVRSIVLCAHWQGKEMVVGDHLGGGRHLLVDTLAACSELLAPSRLSSLLWVDRFIGASKGRALWSNVGRWQRELRP